MDWYILYKGKAQKSAAGENLGTAGIRYYVPVQCVERLEDDRMEAYEEPVFSNLIFIQTEQDVWSVTNAIDGLRGPYIDHTTGKPAIVSDAEMRRFMRFVEMKNVKAAILRDPFERFKVCQKVRVRAGDFAGTEGYVFRIRGDRKLVISLGRMAVAISGIHHSLLEPVGE